MYIDVSSIKLSCCCIIYVLCCFVLVYVDLCYFMLFCVTLCCFVVLICYSQQNEFYLTLYQNTITYNTLQKQYNT